MSSEFLFGETTDVRAIGEYVKEVEALPEWKLVIEARESIQRLITIRGRLPGEKPTDKEDLLFDINSFRGLNWTENELAVALKTMITLETAYYPYVERLARFRAKEIGYPERTPEFIDVGKETVAREIWYRWSPGATFSGNGLHYKVLGGLKFLSQTTIKAFLGNAPVSSIFEGVEDRGKKVNYHDQVKENPIYRLRRIYSRYTLKEIFERMKGLSARERLILLCVSGYVEGVDNSTQALQRFKVDHEMFTHAFESALSNFTDVSHKPLTESAREIVDGAIKEGIIKDPNGATTFFNSPRLKLLNYDFPPAGLNLVNQKIFFLAKATNGNTFRYSLVQIGEKVGNLNKTAVSKRIRRISDYLEKEAVSS
jgi:hypothetical protein